MLNIGIFSNVEDIIGNLTELEAKHVPFATVLSLNRTMAEGQRVVKAGMPGRFHLRNTWSEKGVRTKSATKSNPTALVYTLDWYMRDQEAGATRRPTKAGSMFIPSLEVREGEAITGLVKKGMRPKALLKAAEKAAGRKRGRRAGPAKPTAFIATMGNGKRGLFIRRTADKRLPIVLLYTLQESVKVAPRWGFERSVVGVSDKVMRAEFIKALDQALKSAKGGPIKSAYVSHLAEHGGFDAYGGGGGSNALSGSVLSGLER